MDKKDIEKPKELVLDLSNLSKILKQRKNLFDRLKNL
jgi:hypothetical protein